MKIGIFLQDLKSGGAEKIMVGFANYLSSKNEDEVYLILVRKEGPYLEAISPNVKTIYLNKSKTLYSFVALYNALKKHKIEYLYSTLINVNILALIVCKLLPTKLIIREATTIIKSNEKERRFFIRIANYSSKFMYNWCYKCVAISNVVKRNLIRYTNCDIEKITVIYNPVIINDSKKVNVETSVFHIGFVSRLTTAKNIPTICEVINTIFSGDEKVQVHFFGEGDSEQIRMLQTDHSTSKIILHGFDHSYYSYIKQMNLFIHIPLWEGLGNSVLEVYHSGIPMILSDIESGYLELISRDEPHIHYVDPMDISLIVKIIDQYMNHEMEVRRSRKGLDLDSTRIYKSYRALAS